MSTGTRANARTIFGDHPGVEGGAAGNDRDAATFARSKSRRQRDCRPRSAGCSSERLRDDDRLLENLLLHEVAVIALLDRRGGSAGCDDLALDRAIAAIEDLAPSRGTTAHRPRRDRRCAASTARARARPSRGSSRLRRSRPPAASRRGRRSAARDHREQDRERERAAQARQHRLDRLLPAKPRVRSRARPDARRPRCRSRFRTCARRAISSSRNGEILDDPVVDQRDARRCAGAHWCRSARRGSPSACARYR